MPIGRECDYVCSLCRHDFTYAGNLDPDGLLPHFCPNCGAANGSTTEPVTPGAPALSDKWRSVNGDRVDAESIARWFFQVDDPRQQECWQLILAALGSEEPVRPGAPSVAERARRLHYEMERTPCLHHNHVLKRNEIDCTECWVSRVAALAAPPATKGKD